VSTVPFEMEQSAVALPSGESKPKRASTAHLKVVPQERSVREQIRRESTIVADSIDRSRPLTRDHLQQLATGLLASLGLGESHLGFTMVTISNEFWREQFTATDFKRRLLLLPHCLKHAEGCPADYDEYGLDCRKCGACSIADFKVIAEDLGYKVLVAEGTPIVLKIIISGHVDAILGVACLNVLEKAIDKVLKVGVPSLAIPLLSSDCKNTSVDDEWVRDVIGLKREAPAARTRSYLPLLRAANGLFEPAELERLSPRVRKNAVLSTACDANGNGNGHADVKTAASPSPVALTEAIGYDWLSQGGKRFRPFLTLASYDALRGGEATLVNPDTGSVSLPDTVRRAAMAIETFHKASLVHDDIEDDDRYRYGIETLHRKHGVATAINVGDYLIGLGYRLVSRGRKETGGDCTADILDKLADAHLKLSEGQGAELAWRDGDERGLTPLETLKIYALKTSPAFEAALYSGIRLAGGAEAYESMIPAFSRHLGVAFQIINDLKDWDGDDNNKMIAGQDALAARPTLLLALALEGSNEQQRTDLLAAIRSPDRSPAAVSRIRECFHQIGVFEKAEKLVEKYRAKAESIADEVQPNELRELLYFLVDTVLDREPRAPTLLHPLPIVSGI
jgi:geranylgeranyl diphosphate synthase type II